MITFDYASNMSVANLHFMCS